MNRRTGYASESGYPPKTRGHDSYNGYRDSYDYGDENYYSYSPDQVQRRYGDYSDYSSKTDNYGDKSNYDTLDNRSGSYGIGHNAVKYGSYASGYGDKCPGISIALLLISLLGIALMGYIFYLKVVAAGRKKRATLGIDGFLWLAENIESIVFRGNFLQFRKFTFYSIPLVFHTLTTACIILCYSI